MSIRLWIADDHEVVRQGFRCLFSGTDIEVVGEATNGKQAVQDVTRHKPDVILMDVRMPDVDGLEALEKLRKKLPDFPVVMISSFDNPTYVARSVALGASDFVLKGSPRTEIISAISRAAKHEGPPESSMLVQVKHAMSHRSDRPANDVPLTNRELQVLRHIALGLSNREIGRSLDISVETVKEHVQNILRKIEATDRTQAAVWAVKRGLV
ncbi:MAG: response regulator transcription factor [Planctomycetes bacterium]|nr:response regulator transcription factor [Planctomycetota bacterium]